MPFEIRPCRDASEVAQYDAMGAYVFASPSLTGPEVPTQADWTLCAFDGPRVASTMGMFPFTVRYNGNPVRTAGVTMVGTYPEYRRQGLLRQIMGQGFEMMRERGQPFAILWASMAAIYQRFGYGIAADRVTYDFDPRFVALERPDPAEGTVRMEPLEDAFPVMKRLFIEWATPRNLVIHRSTALWRADSLHSSVKDRPVFAAIFRNEAGEPRGHLVYQLHEPAETEVSGPRQVFTVKDFVALDSNAWRGLWNFIRAHDLAGRVIMANSVGPDDPAPDLLLEPRTLGKRLSDAIWLRVVDAEQALISRPYGARGELTIALHDAMCPWNSGTFLLETDGPSADVRRTDREPDLAVTPNSLAALLAGSRSATNLARANLLGASDEAALLRADAIFRTNYAPFCPNNF